MFKDCAGGGVVEELMLIFFQGGRVGEGGGFGAGVWGCGEEGHFGGEAGGAEDFEAGGAEPDFVVSRGGGEVVFYEGEEAREAAGVGVGGLGKVVGGVGEDADAHGAGGLEGVGHVLGDADGGVEGKVGVDEGDVELVLGDNFGAGCCGDVDCGLSRVVVFVDAEEGDVIGVEAGVGGAGVEEGVEDDGVGGREALHAGLVVVWVVVIAFAGAVFVEISFGASEVASGCSGLVFG